MKVVAALALVEELLNLLVFKDKKGLLFDPTKEQGKQVTGEVGNSYLDALNPLSRLGVIPQHIKNVMDMFTGSSTTPLQTNNQQSNITVEMYVDGEKLSSAVTNTQTYRDAATQHMLPFWVNTGR